ncbi:unnamed protein product [Mytilus coruscus]|uniref:Uncharacterized protein n=1 Tax=Mytilus coruscus TaxID=42192 RepID=A0A6J8A9W7_MYTCO|nr:unnamed protein product [Mytilus coruscus]
MEKCNTLMRRRLLPTIHTPNSTVNCTRYGQRSSQEARLRKHTSEEEADSIWLFDLLNIIGANDVFRKTSLHAGIICEILQSFAYLVSFYHMGSTFEGTVTPESENDHIFRRPKNKPAEKSENYYNLNVDMVKSYRCTTWPTMAQEWLSRHRSFGWPTTDTIQELKSLGFFVVRKGHPLSTDIDTEWRISLSLQERKLIMNLTDVQYKCYVVLKMLNRDTIMLNCITSYHWKTCLFYVIEENNNNIWKKEHLFDCIQLCIAQMLKWIKCGFCPNYFIPKENLFDGKLNNSLRLISENILVELLNVGFDCLIFVKENNICDYVRSRGSIEWSTWLKANSAKLYDESFYIVSTSIVHVALSVFNQRILARYYQEANEIAAHFIKFLWDTLDLIQHSGTISEHTIQETQYSLSLLLPHIYTCLASNISATAIRNQNPQARDFLLFGSFVYFIKSDLSGCLKFLSVLYSAGLYKDCEWLMQHMNEEYIEYIPSYCGCRYIKSDSTVALYDNIRTALLKVSTCVSFLPTELPITPNVLVYEMFRFVGISLQRIEITNSVCHWQYRAVVDSNIFYFLLKYLIKRKLGRVEESENAVQNIYYLLRGHNVRHRDVGFNVLAWILYSNLITPLALLYLKKSWKTMNAWDLCFFISTDEGKRKQYLFNSAKVYALVAIHVPAVLLAKDNH